MKIFNIALLVGGPSPERGISINSARSVLDHLGKDNIEIVPIFFDKTKNPYLISTDHLYSNTPSDFDFRISEVAKPLSSKQLAATLRRCDLVFPCIHGQFGEDGELQSILEEIEVPFVGATSEACKKCFDKFNANEFIRDNGFYAPPSLVLKIYKEDHKQQIIEFFSKHNIEKAVVKPATGGSSIGVYVANSPEEALKNAELLFSKRMDTRVVVEPFAKGKEFTVIILENRFGLPVSLLPTEIEADYEKNQIFDYRKKYLPTRQVTFHCPPRFSDAVTHKIRAQAEQLFKLFGMRDVARFDGWVLDDGKIWFSDFNPISGMEQNSFLFQQGARIGLGHAQVLQHIVSSACRREGLTQPFNSYLDTEIEKKEVAVLFGGKTSERQVSLMSGTNVWLKLLRSKKYKPIPFLLTTKGDVLCVPYALLLNHTVEEIEDACNNAEANEGRLRLLQDIINEELAFAGKKEKYFNPVRYSLKDFIAAHRNIFIALHGGIGEDGELQEMFEKLKVSFNGSGSKASKICMDKVKTGEVLDGLEEEGILVARKITYKTAELIQHSESKLIKEYELIHQALKSKSLIVKPLSDGCSSGIVRIQSAGDLRVYLEYLKIKAERIPAGTFSWQAHPIEMPDETPESIFFEPFIETDKIRAIDGELKITEVSGWVEVTIGILEKDGQLYAMEPSITVAEGEVLSLEEKFQGGTGVNITPVPEEIMKPKLRLAVRERAQKVANTLGINGYARIDLFVQRNTGRIMVIEANSLPGLTASTVLFHQGLVEGIKPSELVEMLVGRLAKI